MTDLGKPVVWVQAEAGEKVRVDNLGGGRVRLLIDDGPAGTTSVLLSREKARDLACAIGQATLGGFGG